MRYDPENNVFWWRQSSFNTFMACPEKLRTRPLVEIPSDAAALGTALHAVIEKDLTVGLDMDGLQVAAYAALEELWNEGVRQVQHGFNTSFAILQNCVFAWAKAEPRENLLRAHYADRLTVEESFDWKVGDVGGTEVRIEGRIDAVEQPSRSSRGIVWDWKTSGRQYETWEHQRWGIQPSFYTLATGIRDFHYLVFIKRVTQEPEVQIVKVTRSEAHWNWLVQQLLAATSYVLSVGFDRPWLTNDHSALCSPKWCPNWDGCKGVHLGPDPW